MIYGANEDKFAHTAFILKYKMTQKKHSYFSTNKNLNNDFQLLGYSDCLGASFHI